MAAAKKKKKSLRLLLLVLVVAALIGVYFLISGEEAPLDENPGEVTQTADKSVVICPLAKENITKISFENQKKIFEEGFTTKKETEGSGLGLRIAKSSMNKMNGDLRLIKSDEKSTIFEIKMNKVEDGGVS